MIYNSLLEYYLFKPETTFYHHIKTTFEINHPIKQLHTKHKK